MLYRAPRPETVSSIEAILFCVNAARTLAIDLLVLTHHEEDIRDLQLR